MNIGLFLDAPPNTSLIDLSVHFFRKYPSYFRGTKETLQDEYDLEYYSKQLLLSVSNVGFYYAAAAAFAEISAFYYTLKRRSPFFAVREDIRHEREPKK